MSKPSPMDILTGGDKKSESGVDTMDMVKGGAAIAGITYGAFNQDSMAGDAVMGAGAGFLAASAVKSFGGGKILQSLAGAAAGGITSGSITGAVAGGAASFGASDFSNEGNAAKDMAGNFMQKLGLSQPGSSEAANNDNVASTPNAPAQRGQSLAM